MGGSSSVRGDQTIYHTDNMCFDGTDRGAPMALDGQLWIGATASNRADNGGHVRLGSITSPLGTLTIGYAAPNITLDLAGGAVAVEHLTANTGGILNPAANNFNIFGAVVAAGTTPLATAGAASTITVNVQTSQAIAAADATKIGLSNFDSASFGVAATGFVTLATSVPKLFTANTGTATPSSNNLNILGGGGIQTAGSGATLTVAVSGGGFTWTDATNATYTLAAQNGYVCDRGGGVTFTLPASGTLGDVIMIVGKLGLWTIAQNALQQIVVGSSSSTIGVTGSVASTNLGDCITLICITAGTSTVWRSVSLVGNLTVT